jgi:hypothetical protein
MQNVDTKIQKIFLHFCYEDYITRDIRTEMAEIMHKNPNLRIIAWYEQATKDSIKHRADNYGIKKMTVDDKPEPFIYVGTQSPEEIEKVKEQIKSTETIIAKSKDKFHWVEFEKKREEYKDKRRRKKKE